MCRAPLAIGATGATLAVAWHVLIHPLPLLLLLLAIAFALLAVLFFHWRARPRPQQFKSSAISKPITRAQYLTAHAPMREFTETLRHRAPLPALVCNGQLCISGPASLPSTLCPWICVQSFMYIGAISRDTSARVRRASLATGPLDKSLARPKVSTKLSHHMSCIIFISRTLNIPDSMPKLAEVYQGKAMAHHVHPHTTSGAMPKADISRPLIPLPHADPSMRRNRHVLLLMASRGFLWRDPAAQPHCPRAHH
jgi:hypothetical protein